MPKHLLSSNQILKLITRMLIQINPSLGNSCVQTTYLVAKILQNCPDSKLELKEAVILSLGYLFGFYHFIGEKNTNRSDLTSTETNHYFIYGYYYLREMSPVGETAKALLFHDRKYDKNIAEKIIQFEYASLLFTADSIQRMIEHTKGNYTESDIENYGFAKHNPLYLFTFKKIDVAREISNKIACGNYLPDLEKIFDSIKFTEEELSQLIKLLVYVIDFKSTQTVQHIIHTAGYAVALGKAMGCNNDELNELYTAGLLHDLGKVSIPNIILECAGKLSALEYRVMQMHVEETENLLYGIVDTKIVQIAIRHHEKLNGKGYPNRLSAKDLTVQQRLLTVADLFSALVDRRSYKGKFPKDKVVEIFKEEADAGAIDASIPAFIEKYYEQMLDECNQYGNLLAVPLGKVEIEYQEEISSELEEFSES